MEGGVGNAALTRVTTAVKDALHAVSSGLSPAPLFLVTPGTNPAEIKAELCQFQLPYGTGVLMRTSGSTTGQGKIVALSWDSLLVSGRATHDYLGGEGIWLNTLPLHHIAGFQTVVRTVSSGFEPLSVDFNNISTLCDALSASPANKHYLSLVPTQLTRLLNSEVGTDSPPPLHPTIPLLGKLPIDAVVLGGAASSTSLLKHARETGLTVVTSYGMTETCGGCIYNGAPIGDTQVQITENGRIDLTGSVVALGYLGDVEPEAFTSTTNNETEVSKLSMRTHRTKDVGVLHSDGTLEVLGRIDDAITTGGLTIMPRLIEAAISDLCAIESVVVGMPDPVWGEAAVAVMAKPFPTDELKKRLATQLERGWAPSYFITLQELYSGSSGETSWPLTDSGKIDRRIIRHTVIDHFNR